MVIVLSQFGIYIFMAVILAIVAIGLWAIAKTQKSFCSTDCDKEDDDDD